MTINNGIDLALQLKASRAFEKLAAMQSARYAEAEALFAPPCVRVDAAAIAQLENIFG
jgi:hypothetical protein